jgi:hypothetical protein
LILLNIVFALNRKARMQLNQFSVFVVSFDGWTVDIRHCKYWVYHHYFLYILLCHCSSANMLLHIFLNISILNIKLSHNNNILKSIWNEMNATTQEVVSLIKSEKYVFSYFEIDKFLFSEDLYWVVSWRFHQRIGGISPYIFMHLWPTNSVFGLQWLSVGLRPQKV